jgi:hypothetical protein
VESTPREKVVSRPIAFIGPERRSPILGEVGPQQAGHPTHVVMGLEQEQATAGAQGAMENAEDVRPSM